MSSWVAVDLDGTLAKYEGWVDDYHIGEPVPKMVEIVKSHLKKGHDVRIFTARVSGLRGNAKLSPAATTELIQDWTERYIGVRLPVTCQKDFGMICLYDDRAKQVVPNEGILIEDLLDAASAAANGG